MRIAVWYNLPSGGGKRALFYHVRGLAEKGHHLEMWCPETADREYLPVAQFGQEHVIALKGWPDNSIPRRALAARRFRAAEASQMHASLNAHCKEVATEVARGGFDVVLVNSCVLSGASPMGRYSPIPSVLYLQEPKRFLYEAEERPPFAANPLLEKGALRLKDRALLFVDDYLCNAHMRELIYHEAENAKKYQLVLANSYYSRESILRAYGVDSRVCYLGVDEKQFLCTDPVREDYLVGLGSIRHGKGVEFIISSVGLVPAPRPRLLWIGNCADASYVEKVKRLASELCVDLDIRIMVSDQELPRLLGKARAMLYAPRLEPFGYSPLEAGACGTPVIAVAEGGVRETVVDGLNGLLVAPEPAAMAEAITRLIEDDALTASLGEQGRQNVLQRWSVAAAVDRLESALSNVLAGNRTG